MNIPLVDLGAQYERIQHEMEPALAAVLQRSQFIGGEPVACFEKQFAAYCSAAYCVGVGNGTDALFLTLKALGIGAGHEVVVPATSFVATAEAVSMAGARPVFADVHPETYTLDPRAVEPCITPRTRALLPVHLYGCPADMDALAEIARRHGLHLIQDAAQAHGAAVNGNPIANYGTCCYSFYPGKNLGAYGDAGAVVTNDEALAVMVRKWANHGRIAKYDHEFPAVNSRLDGLQAAVLSVKLRHLESWTRAREQAAQHYDHLLANIPAIRRPLVPSGRRHVFHLYALQCEKRDGLRQFLSDRGVRTGIHYPTALPFLPAYADSGHAPGDFPVAFQLQNTTLSLPMFPELTQAQQQYIAESITLWPDQ
ncbi:dTDP-4-amino-4,6-dideoxygalactose transaminase [Paucidesulfovibrio gracilis DSM 16080]|uniref:dTDP-4-amino-4,6-dideoxygalactose transaminase n=1 Tax=Paucidesulfovibrio gracilis DSM 16080 TaxID=1121449 RepID=A0A1T4W9E1_9BACT|nr:DegT/DnrJ/EryC1/StrS family aminotransferase [Paucidesulfovibrio gracilis]SKA73883.1 dTDP-4-amino-4,6-dideoxygalactose transaminase [Paucidesulfovibrio gracilis DSM 16080]